jgi:hypothetical protein
VTGRVESDEISIAVDPYCYLPLGSLPRSVIPVAQHYPAPLTPHLTMPLTALQARLLILDNPKPWNPTPLVTQLALMITKDQYASRHPTLTNRLLQSVHHPQYEEQTHWRLYPRMDHGTGQRNHSRKTCLGIESDEFIRTTVYFSRTVRGGTVYHFSDSYSPFPSLGTEIDL